MKSIAFFAFLSLCCSTWLFADKKCETTCFAVPFNAACVASNHPLNEHQKLSVLVVCDRVCCKLNLQGQKICQTTSTVPNNDLLEVWNTQAGKKRKMAIDFQKLSDYKCTKKELAKSMGVEVTINQKAKLFQIGKSLDVGHYQLILNTLQAGRKVLFSFEVESFTRPQKSATTQPILPTTQPSPKVDKKIDKKDVIESYYSNPF